MSSSTTEPVEFSGPKGAARPPAEKSRFSKTCSLLSRYIQEKGSFGELPLGMASELFQFNNSGTQPETKKTMNLFPASEISSEADPTRNISACSRKLLKPMELFAQNQSGFNPPKEDSQETKLIDSSVNNPALTGATNVEPQAAQMTIFYAGQVMVFNDLPADKAKEIMHLASQGSFQGHRSPIVSQTSIESSNVSQVIPSSSNAIPIQPTPSSAVAGDLPRIARRASLHRFLDKRKDRINTKAPYQINSPVPAPGKLPTETKSWLGLAAQFPQ